MKPGYRARLQAALAAYDHETEMQAVADATRNGRSTEEIDALLDARTDGFDGPTTLVVDLLVDLMWEADSLAAHGDTAMDDHAVRGCCGSHWLTDVTARAADTYAQEGAAIAAGAADDDPGDLADGSGVRR